LLFERPPPTDASELDEFKYCLGFPSIEIGITDHGWNILIHTTCRHLQANRCSVFGLGSRPRLCQEIDAVGCHYRINLGTPRPDGFVAVGLDNFSVLSESIVFDQLGHVVAVPSVEVLRQRIEQRV
jgi:hypothetical protein